MRGKVEVSPGVFVNARSKEAKEFLDANPGLRKAPKKPTVEPMSGTETFDFSIPQDVEVGAAPDANAKVKSAKRTKKEALDEDIADIKELVNLVYEGAAAATGWPGWRISEPEAGSIARPAARILARNSRINSIVREVSDPIALIAAVLIPTAARAAAYSQIARQKNVTPPPPPSTQQGYVQPPFPKNDEEGIMQVPPLHEVMFDYAPTE